jgi:hypothetical protein
VWYAQLYRAGDTLEEGLWLLGRYLEHRGAHLYTFDWICSILNWGDKQHLQAHSQKPILFPAKM